MKNTLRPGIPGARRGGPAGRTAKRRGAGGAVQRRGGRSAGAVIDARTIKGADSGDEWEGDTLCGFERRYVETLTLKLAIDFIPVAFLEAQDLPGFRA